MKNELKVAKWLLAVFIVVLILGIGTAAWYLWQAKSRVDTQVNTVEIESVSTADWKTYENAEYNFSLKYPREWPVDEYKIDPGQTSATINFMPKWFKNTDAPYSIYIKKGDIKDTVAYLDSSVIASAPYYKKTEAVFAGQKATQFSYGYESPDQIRIITFQKGDNVFEITQYVKAALESGGKELAVSETISSTFEFTDSVSTTDWKTYTNKDAAYSFEYPANITNIEASKDSQLSRVDRVDPSELDSATSFSYDYLPIKYKGQGSQYATTKTIFISVEKNPKNLGIQDWIKNEICVIDEASAVSLKIGEFAGYKYQGKGGCVPGGSSLDYAAFVKKGDAIFRVAMTREGYDEQPDDLKDSEIFFQKFLSTIKFN